MAEIKIKQVFKVRTGTEVRTFGSEIPVVVDLDGDGRIHHMRWDDAQTDTQPIEIYNSNNSSIPDTPKLLFVKASIPGYLTIGTDNLDEHTAGIPTWPGVWACIGGYTFPGDHGAISANERAENITELLLRDINVLCWAAEDGTEPADVEILAVR